MEDIFYFYLSEYIILDRLIIRSYEGFCSGYRKIDI